jgi:phosphoglycolate phosphatase/pyrophosphatase PpaX
MCQTRYGMTDADLNHEARYWQNYVKDHVPTAYPGIREIMEKQKAAGGLVCVVSHSFDYNIRRDYQENDLPEPDAVYGWERPEQERKPNPFPLRDIMTRFDLKPSEILMIDDLKPGYDMAEAAGVDFAAVGWAYDIPEIEAFMRENSPRYFKTVPELAAWLG